MIPELISGLLDVGKTIDSLSTDELGAKLEPLKTYKVFLEDNNASSHRWLLACRKLSIENHVALVKALVLAIDYFQCCGSNSVVVSPFRALNEKLPCRKTFMVANWIVKNSNCPWVPFGNSGDVIFFKQHTELFEVDSDFTLMQLIHHEREKVRLAREQNDVDQKEKRLLAKQIKHQERIARISLRKTAITTIN